VVALKNTYLPIAAVNTPSPVCEISLVANSRRKPLSASTTRRSEKNDDRRRGSISERARTRTAYGRPATLHASGATG
jgi:hypothetical protein